jgi:hypothetical protein
MSLTEIFPVSFDVAVDVLEFLNDTSSEAVPIEVVEFTNDNAQAHFRLRWDNASHLIENVWTIPMGASPWIAENAPDSELGEWVSVWFPNEKRRDRFFSALIQAG